ncbi:pancreatic triacylglycerol lipase-like [Ptychodera flava]|uniref:pancreatic triacylglycerol lipase-like n=1 Tax=Ptychodera flava TaxID=63121 RepID=UPI00396A2149
MQFKLGLLFCFLASASAWSTTFRLFTRNNRNSYQVIDRNNPSSLTSSNFNPSRDTKFITHGWRQSGSSPFVIDMKNAFLDYSDYNVIAVDWEGGASNVVYFPAASNVYTVGSEVNQFVRFLNSQVGYSYGRVHLIGFSLGAQVSGEAGRLNNAIARITGLDPASPDFEGKGNNQKLDASDAQFVDVIHTDGGAFIGGRGYGTWDPNGHVDFYPNGGKSQPGCGSAKRDVDIDGDKGCDHGRAPEYFTESIKTSCKFNACPCPHGSTCTCSSGYNRMGFHATKSPSGTFYLTTNSASPFCQS